MPEIGEVARIVHFINKHLAGKTIGKVTAQVDENVYGKVGCSAEAFEKALKGNKVVEAKQQGKYFWIVLNKPPHPLMHFGMAGWFHIRNQETAYYKPKVYSKDTEEWPPKYWKFHLETAENPKVEAAFVDFRRFARIRLIDCPADEIRNMSPLVENGPDPVVDKDIVTVDWLKEKLGSKHVPVKALLLDQANISGIGNWVGDEIMYDAKIHPEQYSDTLSAAQISQLHKSLHYVCGFSVENLADSSKFPEEWLFKHRWGKGKKDSTTTLPNGSRFVFLTVGGRTSCVVPSVQKKTGPVAGDVNGTPKAKGKKGKAIKEESEEGLESEEGAEVSKPKKSKRAPAKVKEEETKQEQEAATPKKVAGRKRKAEATTGDGRSGAKSARKAQTPAKKVEKQANKANTGRRRSARVSQAA